MKVVLWRSGDPTEEGTSSMRHVRSAGTGLAVALMLSAVVSGPASANAPNSARTSQKASAGALLLTKQEANKLKEEIAQLKQKYKKLESEFTGRTAALSLLNSNYSADVTAINRVIAEYQADIARAQANKAPGSGAAIDTYTTDINNLRLVLKAKKMTWESEKAKLEAVISDLIDQINAVTAQLVLLNGSLSGP